MSAVEKTETRGRSVASEIKAQVRASEGEFAAALPPHIPVERFMRVVQTAIVSNADLTRADRKSLFEAAMKAAQDGLLPDGRDGAFVIYNTKVGSGRNAEWIKKVQWMPMVAGILKKIRNSGELAMITARVVYAGDKFRYWIDDTGEHIEYEPADDADRSIVRRVFAMARTKDGALYVEPMTPEDVEKVRAVSRAKDSGPWRDWWDQMALKSAIRRLAKRLPMSADLDDLVRRDDALYDFDGDRQAVQTVPLRERLAAARQDKAITQTTDGFSAGFVAGELGAPEANQDRPPKNSEPDPRDLFWNLHHTLAEATTDDALDDVWVEWLERHGDDLPADHEERTDAVLTLHRLRVERLGTDEEWSADHVRQEAERAIGSEVHHA